MSRLTATPVAPTATRTQTAALAGMAAPPLFIAGLVVITWASWDYLTGLGFSLTDHGDSAWPSGLAQGPVGWAQVVNYAAYGALLAAFVHGFRCQLRGRRWGPTASVMLTLMSLGWLLVAFPEDGPPFGEPSTWTGYLHGVGLVLLVFGSPAAMAAVALTLRGQRRWCRHAKMSGIAAILNFFFLFVLVFALEAQTTLGVYGFFATQLIWLETLALRLRG
jgi:Protein of unknown function (DUF998)